MGKDKPIPPLANENKKRKTRKRPNDPLSNPVPQKKIRKGQYDNQATTPGSFTEEEKAEEDWGPWLAHMVHMSNDKNDNQAVGSPSGSLSALSSRMPDVFQREQRERQLFPDTDGHVSEATPRRTSPTPPTEASSVPSHQPADEDADDVQAFACEVLAHINAKSKANRTAENHSLSTSNKNAIKDHLSPSAEPSSPRPEVAHATRNSHRRPQEHKRAAIQLSHASNRAQESEDKDSGETSEDGEMSSDEEERNAKIRVLQNAIREQMGNLKGFQAGPS
jgi:hypothetical protein